MDGSSLQRHTQNFMRSRSFSYGCREPATSSRFASYLHEQASLKVEGTRSWAVIRGARKSALIYVARHPIPDARARVSGSNAVSAPTPGNASLHALGKTCKSTVPHIPACTSDIGNAITTNKEANCEWRHHHDCDRRREKPTKQKVRKATDVWRMHRANLDAGMDLTKLANGDDPCRPSMVDEVFLSSWRFGAAPRPLGVRSSRKQLSQAEQS
uniref:Uncharacterized protein n=1 Tax=Coccidioides posadasii RMSCC 3488 TaxID=454284 RepID=A0A0J6FTY1_COCPO|nr:hypothetical protein CPAG_08863 [Coccidioides posadasii RMSCC 3488]